MVMGIYKIDGLNPVSYLLPAVALPLSSGVFEELRCSAACCSASSRSGWAAGRRLVVIAGVRPCPSDEPGRNTDGRAIFISVEAGVLLAAAYMLTRRLWMSMASTSPGTTPSPESFQAPFQAAGAEPGLIKPVIDGPVLLIGGGTFGVESSGVARAACTATGVVLLVMAVRRGHVVAPFWKRNG